MFLLENNIVLYGEFQKGVGGGIENELEHVHG